MERIDSHSFSQSSSSVNKIRASSSLVSESKIPVFNGHYQSLRNRRSSTSPSSVPQQQQPFYACHKSGQQSFNHTITDMMRLHHQQQELPETVKIHQHLHNRINHFHHNNNRHQQPTFGSNSRFTKDLIRRSSSTGLESLSSTPALMAESSDNQLGTTPISSSSTSSSSSASKNNNCSKKKRNVYAEYLPLCQMQKGLQKGEIVEGILRINQRNYNDAYISAPDGGLDIFISGLIDRNKALNGDCVAVKLYPEDRWLISYTTINLNWSEWKNDLETLIETVDSDVDFDRLNLNSKDSNLLNQGTKAACSGEKPLSTEMLLREEFPNLPVRLFGLKIGQLLSAIPYWRRFIQRKGVVVHILEKNHPRTFAGFIRFDSDKDKKNSNSNYLMLTSNDRRNPQIILPKSSIDPVVLRDGEKYRNYLFLVEITDWPAHSLYPQGKIIQSFGPCGEIETETAVQLATLSIKTDDFPEQAVQEYQQRFPAGKEWNIPPEEYDYRRDFRSDCVFTIDPETAKDLDDAVSFTWLTDDRFEIGVHIADVSYFIGEGTMLDEIAKDRATSVYLVSRVIPMLPHLFCQDLCSLNAGEDKLTFSVVFTCDTDGNIYDTWFGRTVINSCAKLTYEQAQKFLESTDKFHTLEKEMFPKFHGPWTLKDVCERVQQLHRFASTLRRRRFETGSLRLKKKKLNFLLDQDGMPVALNNYETRDSNWLIEELMLLANKAAAEVLFIHFGRDGRAFLRGHPPMDTNATQEFFKFMKNANIVDFRLENTAALYQSLQELEKLNEKYFQICTMYFIKSMKLAQYLCASDQDDPSRYHHFALNFDKYTHFTSPIRRYADIIVHRLLATALGYQSTVCRQSKAELGKIANNCNTRKYNAFLASEKSTEIYLKAYVRKIGAVICKGIVFQVFDHSFDVLLLDFSLMVRVYVDQLWVESSQFIRNKVTGIELKLIWKQDNETESKRPETEMEKLEQSIKSFDELNMEVRVTEKFDFKVIIAHPNGRFIQKPSV